VGAQLFERTRREVSLTPAGESFRQHATLALLELERATLAAGKAARGETGRLALRFTLMSALTVLPQAVACFHRAFPDVTLEIEPGGTTDQLEALVTGHADVGFMAKRTDEIAPLASELLERAELVALVPTKSPLAKRRRLALKELASSKFLFLRQASEPDVRRKFRSRCLAAGFEPDVLVEVDQLEVLLAFVAGGLGVSCVPALVRRVPFPGVSIVPLADGVRGGISMVWNPTRLSPVAKQFLDVVRRERDRAD